MLFKQLSAQRLDNRLGGKIIDVAEVNQLHWLEESGQRLEKVDRTHLVLASGKPVLQKRLDNHRKMMVKVLTVKIRPVHVIEKQVELCRLRLHDTVQGDAHLGRWFGGQVLATNRWNFGENFGVSVLQEKVRQVRFSIEVRLIFFC